MTRTPRSPHRYPPRLELLEDRCVPAFGTNGIVLTDVVATSGEWIQSTALQADGKVVVAGNVGVARYGSDGALDGTFNPSGSQPGVVTSAGSYFNAVAVQADGKVLAAGTNFGDFLLRRYTTTGAVDLTFGSGGMVTTSFQKNQRDEAYALAIQPWNQKIIAVGIVNGFNGSWGVVRYNPNGSLDTTFNGSGKLTGFGGGKKAPLDGQAFGVAVQPDRKVVVVGRVNSDFAVARYTEYGALDSTFGQGGNVLIDFLSEYSGSSSSDVAYDVALQADGKIVISGQAVQSAGGYGHLALARLNGNGSLDGSFAGNGKLAHPGPWGASSGRFNGVAVQPDGKIVAVGTHQSNVAVARFAPNGSPDLSFDGDGWQLFYFNPAWTDPDSAGNDVVIQPDGKVLVVGSTSDDPSRKFALARLNPDGSFDADAPLSAAAPPAPQQGESPALDLAFEAAAGPAEGGFSTSWYDLGLLLEQLQKKR